jgi:ABC-2 type transport system ATP-binding protein
MGSSTATTAEPPVIAGTGITKVFRDFWGRPRAAALRDASLTIPAGSIFGLLGPNGAGKSTLMKLLLGHLYPTAGTLTVFGRSPRDVATKARIGYLPERTSFYANLTALETLRFFARLLGLAPAVREERIRQLLAMVGLQDAGSRLVGEYSHGMRKRLGLAQALLNDPDLLLLDEPTAGMDPIGCREIKDLILTLGRRGKTILLSSHLLADIEDVCDTVMGLYGGRVQAVGTLEELLARRNEVLIRAPSLSPEVLAQIKGLVRREHPDHEPEVSTPLRTLEDYFLSVVADAQRRQETTSGAGVGTGIAAFLRDGAASPPGRES